MKIALLLCTYNRHEYLKQTLESLNRANLDVVDILIIDDCSTDPETLKLIEPYTCILNESNKSIRYSLLTGFNLCFEQGYDIVINMDSDALVRNDFIERLLEFHAKVPDMLLTGFNCNTLSLHGNIRHHVISEHEGYNIKKSAGGINMLVTPETYKKYVKPALEKTLAHRGNWDHEACIKAGGIACIEPSVIQHIGFESSMGHTGIEPPDTATDFKPLALNNVTLIGIDCLDIERLLHAASECCKDVHFGSVRILSSIDHIAVTDKIEPITSKQAYSQFCIKELYKYIDTEYCLVFQYDGYVKNWKSWDNTFFKYDYIGAPWEWLSVQKVGNGGFSLRSKKLMEMVAIDPFVQHTHPEDDAICHKYGTYLERKRIKFAPVELARKFSIEGWKADKQYRNQFGFHGTEVRFEPNVRKMLVCQPHGLGDVIFCQTLIHALGDYEVTWPVKPHFVDDLNRAYPSFKFIPDNQSPVNLDLKKDMQVNGYRLVPIRHANYIKMVHYIHCMRVKYDMYKQDYKTWRERAMWVRDGKKEQELFDLLQLPDNYTIVNTTFGCDFQLSIQTPAEGIQLRQIEGYSLFDWALVLERASAIHTVSTSILYILDLLETCPVHVYVRKPQEFDHRNYNYIFTNKKFIYC